MKFKNEATPKKAVVFKVIGGITIIYEKENYTEFFVKGKNKGESKSFKVKDNEILKAFIAAERYSNRLRVSASPAKRGSSAKKKEALSDDTKQRGKAIRGGRSLEDNRLEKKSGKKTGVQGKAKSGVRVSKLLVKKK